MSYCSPSCDPQLSGTSASSLAETDFSFGCPQTTLPAQEELSWYLTMPCDFELNALKKNFPLTHRLFLKMNTAVPSSASVERLFSVGTDVFVSKQGKLPDANYEK